MEKEVYDIDKEIYDIGKEIFNYLKANFKVYTVEECKQLKNEGAFGFIYITQCKVNGKLYIGQRKLSEGFRTYLGSGTLLLRAVEKYDKENFERIILEVAYSKEELDNFEIKYIELFDASKEDLFYNIALGGSGGVCLIGENNPFYGKHHSEEARKKQSEGHKGKEFSEEHKKNLSEAQRGRKQTEEAKKKIGKAHKGKEVSKETRNKIGKIHRGKKLSEETKKKRTETRKKNRAGEKLVICVFPSGETTKPICISDLAKELGISRTTIRDILNSHEPYKPTYKRLKHLDGIIIMTQEDYLNTLKNINTNINDDKAS